MNLDYQTHDGLSIPGHMQGALLAYIQQGQEVGNFLYAVLTNDLQNAVGRADLTNRRALPAYVEFLYNEAPADCYGSAAKVEAWVARGGLLKRAA